MVRKEDWNKDGDIPKESRLLAIIKSDKNPEGFYAAVIRTGKGVWSEPAFARIEGTQDFVQGIDILWWQTVEMPFGMEDDRMSWDYVVRYAPNIKDYPHERYTVTQDDDHNAAIYGCMWRVTSPHDKDRTADIYVCTTNNPKYRETLFLYERFRKMRVFTDIWQRVLVDRVGYAKFSGDCMDLSLVDFLGAKDV